MNFHDGMVIPPTAEVPNIDPNFSNVPAYSKKEHISKISESSVERSNINPNKS